jgi:type II secretory pathway pseudopilin PulG
MQRRYRPYQNQPAYRPALTLVEIVIVLAIIGLMAGIAINRYGQSLARWRVDSAARRVVADIELARRTARHKSSSVVVAFDNRGFYGINELNDPDRPGERYRVVLTEPPYLSVLAASFGGGTSVAFDAYGQATPGGTVSVRHGALVRIITVDPLTSTVTVTEGDAIEPVGGAN